jgi:rRNA maturation endonuclease Nob1
MPDPAAYRCIACHARWTYAQVRNLARCPACGSGLQLLAPAAATTPSRL